MLAHTRAAKKHAKILLFFEMGKFYREKVCFLGDFLYKNQFCYLDFAKSPPIFPHNTPYIKHLDAVINTHQYHVENTFLTFNFRLSKTVLISPNGSNDCFTKQDAIKTAEVLQMMRFCKIDFAKMRNFAFFCFKF